MKSSYNRADVEKALQAVGLKRGDIVFSHSNVGYFGMPEGGVSVENLKATILNPILELIGSEGTFIVPTFTYSFTKHEAFDPNETKSVCGVLTEVVRKHPQAYRSEDPIFSVAAIGSRAKKLTTDVSIECFGKDSFWDRFYHADGVILNMNFGVPTTFFHYVERNLDVPYRYDKFFIGVVHKNGRFYQKGVIYFCRDMTNNLISHPDWMGIQELAYERGLLRMANIGRGYITLARARDLYDLIVEILKTNPFFLTNSRNSDVMPKIIRSRRHFRVNIPRYALMDEIIDTLKDIPRHIVSDGCNAALKTLATQISMTVYEYPTGTKYCAGVIPEKWTCYEGYLETLGGKKLFSYAENAIHVASYSRPFEGKVSRKELFEHLWVHPKISNAIPEKFVYYDMEWGLCCSQETQDTLTEDYYKVVIKSDFSYDTLKIGEVVISGIKKDCIILCTHLCNQAQANDGLAGVALGIDVFRELQRMKGLKYTYRLLIVPQNFTVIAHLNKLPEVMHLTKGILFLEMLGSDGPHILKTSGYNTDFDKSCATVLKEFDFKGSTCNFSLNAACGEYRCNLPDIHIPMLSLSRVIKLPNSSRDSERYFNFRYVPDLILSRSLLESKELIMKIIDKWELH